MSPLEGVLDVRGGVVCGGGGATARTGERLGGVVDMVFGAHAGGGGAVFAAEVVVGVVEAGHDDNVLEVVWVVEKVVVVVLCKWVIVMGIDSSNRVSTYIHFRRLRSSFHGLRSSRSWRERVRNNRKRVERVGEE